MARTYVNASSTAATTNNTTTYNNKTSVNITPKNGTRYAIFWGCTLSHSATNSDGRARLQKTTTTAITLQQFNIEPGATTNIMSITDVQVWTSDTTTQQTFAVQFSAEGGTTTIRDAYITILELYDNELSSTTIGATSTTVATPTTLNSITLPQGDWYVIASLGLLGSATAQPANVMNVNITDGTTTYMNRTGYESKDNTNYTPVWLTTGLVQPTDETTYSLQFAENGNTTITSQYRTIVALKRSLFADSALAYDLTQSTTTSTTAQTKLTLTHTPSNAVNYLVLGWWTTETSATGTTVTSNFLRGGTTRFTSVPLRTASDVDTQFQQGWTETQAQTAASTSWTITYLSGTSGTTVRIENTAILILNLDTPPPFAYAFGYFLFA